MTNSTSHSDFWLEDHSIDWDFDDSIDTSQSQCDETAKMIRLSAARRAISNYVSILTNKNIPVLFNNNNNSMTDGKTVYIGADANDKKQFDVSVGLALHEASHIRYSDFELFKQIWQLVPREITKLGKAVNVSREEVMDLLKTITNIVEDRYIDHTVYYSAPGYRGYYQSLYDKYFNAKVVDDGLKSEMYRVPSVDSYLFRIINITNHCTDLTALPGLFQIAKILNLSNIDRLKTPKRRFEVACEIVKVILKNIDEYLSKDKIDNLESDNGNKSTGEKDDSKMESETFSIFEDIKNNSDDIDDILGGDSTNVNSSEDKDPIKDIGDDEKLSNNKKTKLSKAFSKQKDFLDGKVKRKKVSKRENDLLDILEKSKIDLVDVGQTYIADQYSIPNGSVECILVKNMTKDLIMSEDFPLSSRIYKYSNHQVNDRINTRMVSVVNAGISMGIKLGKRLQFRNEVNVEKFSRRDTGKIDKRLINELGYDIENIFYNNIVSKYKKMHFHISIDASSSMTGGKWEKTIKLSTAIAKAASMLENIRVSISLRATYNKSCYVVIAYDSKKDKFIKIKNLFPFLNPIATTPEGLAFEAILKVLPIESSNSENYFINISDGEPNFTFNDNKTKNQLTYGGVQAAKHTKMQCNKIRKMGYNIISYFVSERDGDWSNVRCYGGYSSRELFKQMYGNDAIFTNVDSLNQIVKTLNKKLIESIDI